MIELSIGATSVAHAIHYAVLGVGLVGLLALLGPQLIGARQRPSVPDDHAMRVLALTEQISSGGLGLGMTPALPAARVGGEPLDRTRSRYVPVAVVSSAAAAGVHAAVGPEHFRELAVFGLFFASVASAQLAWSVAMVRRPSHALLVVAVVGNAAVLLLWLVTRTIGLPGLLAEPESVGVLDLCADVWEMAVVLAAGQVLRAQSGIDLKLSSWRNWDPSARAWTLGSACTLIALTLAGVGA